MRRDLSASIEEAPKIERLLSQSRDATKQRKSRAKRKAGFRSHRLYFQDRPIVEAMVYREKLTRPPTDDQIDRCLEEMVMVTVRRWLRARADEGRKGVTSDHPPVD